uniref:Uncharacterized protein n=1 Tax=Schlesneria paludicola TaxID=360056 RepID=A0A7C2P249_9PLAN
MIRWTVSAAGWLALLAMTPTAWGDAPPPQTAPTPIAPIPEVSPPQFVPPPPADLAATRTLAPATQAWAHQGAPSAAGPHPAYSTPGAGPGAGIGPFWAPGGYEPRGGSPYYYHDPMGGQFSNTGNPYYDHYGPGFHRHSLHGHYRFPYYTYRAPWYYPGRAVYNRDTNLPW